MVIVGTGNSRSAVIKTNFPVERGLIAGTTSQTGNSEFLSYERSFVEDILKDGIN